ncbi:hypothetical protein E1B28_005222 [Marasmius oreades]|uniref:Nicotinamide riboside kinase n=1 Tax=Marasmius oreades TaxID=181124 RepID=A0A9P7V0E6_9AGAR|nr:uncharacterized protein E1B28_005222 [Marasmius oreades]KAG7097910.1 hypothetical protein E1B28_005222 [Marasmius oreades]
MLPVDPDFGFPHCDDAPSAIDWDRMTSFLSDVKRTGFLPSNHQSYANLLESPEVVPIDDHKLIPEWKTQSKNLALQHLEKYGEKLVWVLVDGFLLYWDEVRAKVYSLTRLRGPMHHAIMERLVSSLDVRFFLRVPEDLARARREARVYHTPEGYIWHDPPQYWERAAWPGYIQAHKHMFEDGDVTNGQLSGKVEELVLIESTEVVMTDMVKRVMEKVLNVSAGVGSKRCMN